MLTRAKAAAVAVASSLGLPADDAAVLFSSNKLALRLLPCDVVARVASAGLGDDAELELLRARRLAEAGCPVGAVLPRVDPLVHERDGFAVSLWTYYDPAAYPVSPEDYAHALVRLHAGLRTVDLDTPRLADRVAQAQEIVGRPDLSPDLVQADRSFLGSRIADLHHMINTSGAPEQLLHGEPHPGNVLGSRHGPLFIDFETLCRGPVEFDLAHVPEAACEQYPGADQDLLGHCRQLVLAMIAAWRWEADDQFPNREYWRHALLHALREGLPWPTPETVSGRFEAP